MEIKVRSFTSTIIIAIMALLLYSNYKKGRELGKNLNTKVLIVTGSICIANLIYTGYSATSDNINKDNIYLLLLGIFSIASIGYTIYEWDTMTVKPDECSNVIPTSTKFSGDSNPDSTNYYVYRTMYLMTLIFLVVVLQFKVDDSTFSPLNMDKRTLHKVLFLLPFIMPVLTELVTLITNSILGDTPDLKPETLLLNFIKGDAKKEFFSGDPEWYSGSWWRSVMPILLYLTLMGLAILSGMGKIGTDGGKTAIFIIACFLIFFSFIMRTLFVQDCVVENEHKVVGDSGTNSFPCLFEKYGGIQTMLNVCLIIIIIYHVEKPSYKLLFFTVIMLASWGLSSTYMLNKYELENDAETPAGD